MIYSVSGKLAATGKNFAVVEVAGIGIKIFVHQRTLTSLPPIDGAVKFFTHLNVREDLLDLYGFLSREESDFFQLLTSVSGVGPKSALAILDVAPMKELTAAIKEGRPDLMTRASGIGSKTGERIILELRNKVKAEQSEESVKKMESDADIVETLAGLGYRRDEVKIALQKVDDKIVSLEARLKAALKILSGKK
ncbi:MAG: Holliday junction branch migration protein RuvA [Candidatus Liptonbacteria bacterium]|nr:Holliday junction branch migration protein RuvA [Candidatus Liptonbacteria bacterium]